MNCRELKTWLLEVKGGTVLPPAASQHLAACPGCARYWEELRAVDSNFQNRNIPEGDPRGLENFLSTFDAIPSEILRKSSYRWRQRFARCAFAGTAACVFVLLGFTLGQKFSPKPQVVEIALRGEPVPAAVPEPLVAKLAKHDMRIAGTKSAAEHAVVFATMADDLLTEAIRLAHRCQRDELLLVVELHDRILRRGLLVKWEQLPVDERMKLRPEIDRRLTENETRLAAELRKLIPMAVELIQPMGETTGELRAALAGAVLPKPLPPMPSATGREPMLVVLCHTGLKLAEEADPLKRADICSDTATQFAQASVFASAERPDIAAQYIRTLDDWVDQTIQVNIDLGEAADATGDRQKVIAEIRHKANSAVTLVETHLEKASPEVQSSVQQALRASAKHPGSGKAKGKPETLKGPPWLRDTNSDKINKGKGASAK